MYLTCNLQLNIILKYSHKENDGLITLALFGDRCSVESYSLVGPPACSLVLDPLAIYTSTTVYICTAICLSEVCLSSLLFASRTLYINKKVLVKDQDSRV